MWLSEPRDGRIGVAVEGDKLRPSCRAIEIARSLVQTGKPLLAAAHAFVLQDENALDFLQHDGSKLVDGGFTVLESGEFEVDFLVTDWPDAMITVKFKDGVPWQVLVAD